MIIIDLHKLAIFSLDAILRVNDHANYPVQKVDRINTSNVDEYWVLRNWIYKLLENDIEKLFQKK